MHIYVFRSDAKRELHAFTDDLVGSKLPKQFSPWRTTGAIAPGKAMPHGFSRDQIEEAINNLGFQIWRMKPKVDAVKS